MDVGAYSTMVLMVAFAVAVPAALIITGLVQIRDAAGEDHEPPAPVVEQHLHLHYYAGQEEPEPPSIVYNEAIGGYFPVRERSALKLPGPGVPVDRNRWFSTIGELDGWLDEW
jgi:hypothetical protein